MNADQLSIMLEMYAHRLAQATHENIRLEAELALAKQAAQAAAEGPDPA